jgi:transglutaminase-like putative cysteine protease
MESLETLRYPVVLRTLWLTGKSTADPLKRYTVSLAGEYKPAPETVAIRMKLRAGYELRYEFPQPTPLILMLNVHFSRVSDLATPDHILVDPAVPLSGYRDGFGNWCTRILSPAGRTRISADFVVRDTGLPDQMASVARQVPVEELPEETLVFLLASRFCDSDRLLDLAWTLFGSAEPGRARVQAICDFTHQHISFGYEHARVTRTAGEAYEERRGVCRDYAHLAVAFCRALNIPARYCTGYLSDVGTPLPYPPGDFAAWFEAFLDGAWHTFDPRNNVPRIGRILMARGRDAADVAITTTFGPNTLEGFRVWADEITESAQ